MRVKINQFAKQSDAWKRSLAFLSEENFFLKLRLGDLLHGSDVDAEVLEAAEYFNNGFLQKDEMISLMFKNLSKFDDLLSGEINEDRILAKDIMKQQKNLRDQMAFLEADFFELKIRFNEYINELAA
jgi:hypothetical protein